MDAPQDAPIIEEAENGPLRVKRLPRLVGRDGEELEVKPVTPLCRCGHSSNKPFCDGTHNEVGFRSRDNRDASGENDVRRYDGRDVSVYYNPRVCSHAAKCVASLNAVFDPERDPWIEPDNAGAEAVEEAVRLCPSGALRIAEPGGVPEHRFQSGQVVGIVVQANGPLEVTDIPPPAEMDAEGMTERKYVLCRCGLSGMKPYCDGSHHNEGWRDDG